MRIGKVEQGSFAVSSTQDSQVLTNAFLATAFRLGFGNASDKNYLRSKKCFLEPDAVWRKSLANKLAQTKECRARQAYLPIPQTCMRAALRKLCALSELFDPLGKRREEEAHWGAWDVLDAESSV